MVVTDLKRLCFGVATLGLAEACWPQLLLLCAQPIDPLEKADILQSTCPKKSCHMSSSTQHSLGRSFLAQESHGPLPCHGDHRIQTCRTPGAIAGGAALRPRCSPSARRVRRTRRRGGGNGGAGDVQAKAREGEADAGGSGGLGRILFTESHL